VNMAQMDGPRQIRTLITVREDHINMIMGDLRMEAHLHIRIGAWSSS
jgi:hypothetical protein